jgi:hypothetical protein
LTQTKPAKPLDTAALAEAAKNSKDKEAYRQLQKTGAYRIGVGARANPPNAPSFFVEVMVRLADASGEVDLPRLERAIGCLKALQARGYALTYEDGNCISCETKNALQNPNEEILAVEALMKRIFE